MAHPAPLADKIEATKAKVLEKIEAQERKAIPKPIDYLVGLRRMPTGYSLVVAKMQGKETLEYEVDSTVQPLQFTAQQLLARVKALVAEIP